MSRKCEVKGRLGVDIHGIREMKGGQSGNDSKGINWGHKISSATYSHFALRRVRRSMQGLFVAAQGRFGGLDGGGPVGDRRFLIYNYV